MDKFLTTDLNTKVTEYYKIKEGSQRLRILSSPLACYQGFENGRYSYSWAFIEGYSRRFNAYVLVDGKIMWWAMPKACAMAIQALAKDPDTAFKIFPMPFDIKINAIGAGTKDVNYIVNSSPLTAISAGVLKDLADKPRIQDVLEEKILKQEVVSGKPASMEGFTDESFTTF